jgi:uncharacterized protein (DUF885 family)
MIIYQKFFEEELHLFPSINELLNLSQYKYLNNQLENPYDSSHIVLQKKLYKKYLIQIRNKKLKSLYDKCLEYVCAINLSHYNYNYDLTPINHQENMIEQYVDSASGNSIIIFDTKQNYPLDCLVDSMIKNMERGVSLKYTLPKLIAIELETQFKSILEDKSYRNQNVKFDLGYNYNDKLDEIFIPILKKLIKFMKFYKKYCRESIGMCKLPNGINEYRFLVRSQLSLKNVNIPEIYKYGVKEVKRIHREMMGIKDKLDFKGSLKQFNDYLHHREDLKFNSSEEKRESYQNIYNDINKTIIKNQFNEEVKEKCAIVKVPKYNEMFSAEAYYMPGDLDGKRKGKFYINMKDIKDNNKIEVESLFLHEAVPGHHYQITYVNKNPKIPTFIKTMNACAYHEGWALYCELLGEYKTLESYYGKLVMEMVRALRLVVDTGIHYYGWSYQKTTQYYKKYSFNGDLQIKSQILRYIALPGQALCYKIGEKIILDLKKEYEDDIKSFHTKILENGPIPLWLLQEQFD